MLALPRVEVIARMLPGLMRRGLEWRGNFCISGLAFECENHPAGKLSAGFGAAGNLIPLILVHDMISDWLEVRNSGFC